MNIGVDIDDTITNTYETLLTIISMKYGLNHKKLISQRFSYTEIFNKLDNFNVYKKDLFYIMSKSVTLKENVVEILNKLKEEGHNIIFITARNYDEYNNPYKVCYDYLMKNNIPFDKLFVNIQDKDNLCKKENIDLFIDDSVIHCTKVNSVGIKTIQFNTDFTSKLNGIKHVSSWNEIYKLLHN